MADTYLTKDLINFQSKIMMGIIAVIVFGTLLVTACFIKMIRELCLESQNDDDDEEEDRAGYKSFS